MKKSRGQTSVEYLLATLVVVSVICMGARYFRLEIRTNMEYFFRGVRVILNSLEGKRYE